MASAVSTPISSSFPNLGVISSAEQYATIIKETDKEGAQHTYHCEIRDELLGKIPDFQNWAKSVKLLKQAEITPEVESAFRERLREYNGFRKSRDEIARIIEVFKKNISKLHIPDYDIGTLQTIVRLGANIGGIKTRHDDIEGQKRRLEGQQNLFTILYSEVKPKLYELKCTLEPFAKVRSNSWGIAIGYTPYVDAALKELFPEVEEVNPPPPAATESKQEETPQTAT